MLQSCFKYLLSSGTRAVCCLHATGNDVQVAESSHRPAGILGSQRTADFPKSHRCSKAPANNPRPALLHSRLTRALCTPPFRASALLAPAGVHAVPAAFAAGVPACGPGRAPLALAPLRTVQPPESKPAVGSAALQRELSAGQTATCGVKSSFYSQPCREAY